MTRARSDTTHFGFEAVPLAEKQARVDEVFGSVARRYDLMNDLMSAGLHRIWKRDLVSMLRPPRTRPFRHLDVAGGTGDVAFRVAEAGGPQTRVTVADINPEMLAVGRARAETRGETRVEFREANAESLPFPDRSYDGYTIAFGIRNVPRIERALAEARRVLRPGSRFLCLEFSRVDVPGLDRIYDAYSFT
jgi:demethylmenaquinone methyltransferase/2-methoxy-6-polyprenyl-1,4-benzoquinol methylase